MTNRNSSAASRKAPAPTPQGPFTPGSKPGSDELHSFRMGYRVVKPSRPPYLHRPGMSPFYHALTTGTLAAWLSVAGFGAVGVLLPTTGAAGTYGESIESALRRFKRKVQQEDIIKDIKKHSFYLKPGDKRRAKQALARKRSRKKLRRETE